MHQWIPEHARIVCAGGPKFPYAETPNSYTAMQFFRLLPLLTLATAALAQSPIVIPNGYAATEGNSSTGWPWNRGTAQIRIQYIYDSSHFTNQGVSSPIVIDRLRWRANGGALGGTGTYSQVDVQLATCPLDYAAASTTFANNLGTNAVTTYSGPVSVSTGAGTTPNNWYVDIVFATPFLYDPAGGDLTVDIATNATGWAGTAGPAMDAQTTNSLTSRVYNLTSFTSPTGTFQNNVGAVLEVNFQVGQGFASAESYGNGCYNRASTSIYEAFTGANLDLAGNPVNSIRFTPTGGNGYVVTPGTNLWYTPTSPDLLLTDDSLSAPQALGFAFPYPGGSTTDIRICSNGFVWLRSTETLATLAGTPALLLNEGPRLAPLWTDLNPASLLNSLRVGSVHFEIDPVSGDAVITWLTVPEFGVANINNRNTFQLALSPSGAFEMRYQTLALTTTRAVLVGYSPGLGALDPGATDLSTALPVTLQPDLRRLQLSSSPRPSLGANVSLDTTSIIAGSSVGVMVFGFNRIDPGIDLGGFGMPGCSQFASLDSTQFFLIGGTSHSFPFAIPNAGGLAGLQLRTQSVVLVPGINPLGAVTSNGRQLNLNLN